MYLSKIAKSQNGQIDRKSADSDPRSPLSVGGQSKHKVATQETDRAIFITGVIPTTRRSYPLRSAPTCANPACQSRQGAATPVSLTGCPICRL